MGLFNSAAALFKSNETGETAKLAASTFRYQRSSALMEGAGAGAIGLATYVLERGAGAPEFLVALMGVFTVGSQVLAFPFGMYFQGRQKGPLFIVAATTALVAGLGFLLFPPGPAFCVWLLLFGLSGAVMVPARNSIFQSNYAPRERSRFLGNVTMFSSIATIALMLLVGAGLDMDHRLYKVFFPAAMLLTAAAALNYRRIPTSPGRAWPADNFRTHNVLRQFVDLFRKDRLFLWFELGFFTYGLGVMVMWSVLPIYFNKHLNASFTQFSMFGIINTAIMVFAPLVGKWADLRTPPRVAATAFGVLAFVPIILWMAPTVEIALLAAFVQAGAMIGVHITWNLGPVFFSGNRDTSSYSGAHATLAGCRALIAFPFAAFMRTVTHEFWPLFLLSCCLLVTASTLMLLLDRKARKSSRFVSTASGRFEVSGD